MKDYFNQNERRTHIKILSVNEVIRDFAKSSAVSEEERKELLRANKSLDNLNKMIFGRLGASYQKVCVNMVQDNDLVFVTKGTNSISKEDIPSELLQELIKYTQSECINCENCNFKECVIFKINNFFGEKEISQNGCPFKLEL